MVNRRVGNLRKENRGGGKGGFFSRYRPPAADHVKRQAERRGGKFDSIFKGNFDTFTPKEGDNVLRILPAGWEGHADFAFPVWVHFGIGADESSYLCLRKMKDETCPICQEVARMKADGETEDAKRIDCKERFVCWAIDRSDRDEDPALYSMPATVYKDLNALCYSSKTGKAIFVDNPDTGYDITIRRTGAKRNTRYLPQVDRDPSPVTDDDDKYKELEEWVQDNQIPDCLQFFDADYLEKALGGELDRNDKDGDERSSRRSANDDQDDEAPRSARRRGGDDEERGGRGRPAEEDDLDDELPFDDEDESENEAREARQERSGGRGREDSGEDEDATEDRPTRNRGRSSRDERDEDRPRSRHGRVDDQEADEDEPPRRGREDADTDEDRPRRRGRDEEDESPRRTRVRTSGNRRV